MQSAIQDTISRMLAAAQAELRTASWTLAKQRRCRIYSNRDERMLHEAEQDFLAALDRMHEVQCMTVVSF
jgi:hypothetical protein